MRRLSGTLQFKSIVPALTFTLSSMVGGVFLFLALTQQTPVTINAERFIVLTTCVIIFVCADLLAGRIEGGLWAGYLNLVVMVMFFSTTLLATITLVLGGSLLALIIRLQGGLLPGASPMSRAVSHRLALKRIALHGTSLLGAWVVYTLLGGVTPITFANFALLPTFFGLITGIIITQV
ncbi:MAG: hypothetical protein MUE54_12850, partial [Anaerolineae bacterium]|nr:hypothetical protein [Anaerolineae bacterium]